MKWLVTSLIVLTAALFTVFATVDAPPVGTYQQGGQE